MVLNLAELPGGVGRWTADYLAAKMPSLHGVKASNTSSTFAFWSSSDNMEPYAMTLGKTERTAWGVQTSSIAEVLDHGVGWRYWSVTATVLTAPLRQPGALMRLSIPSKRLAFGVSWVTVPVPAAGFPLIARSAELGKTQASVLLSDMTNRQAICPADCRGRVDNVWVSSGGVTAQAHYDLVNNFFVQVSLPPWPRDSLRPRINA